MKVLQKIVIGTYILTSEGLASNSHVSETYGVVMSCRFFFSHMSTFYYHFYMGQIQNLNYLIAIQNLSRSLTSNPHFTWTNCLWLTLRQLKLLIELCLPFALSLAARGWLAIEHNWWSTQSLYARYNSGKWISFKSIWSEQDVSIQCRLDERTCKASWVLC